jgi:hypothetical protein
MAFFTPSCLISEIRGSVGNQTFSRNAHGNIVKEKLVQTVQNTARQQVWRDHLADAVTEWQSLTDAERKAFYSIAKDFPRIDSLGKKQILTGYHFFVGKYVEYKSFGLTYTGQNEAKIPTVAPTLYQALAQGTEFRVQILIPSTVYFKSAVIYATDQLSPGIKYLSPPRFQRMISANLTTVLDVPLKSSWEAAYGTYTQDLTKNLWIKAHLCYERSSQVFKLPTLLLA